MASKPTVRVSGHSELKSTDAAITSGARQRWNEITGGITSGWASLGKETRGKLK